METSCSCCSPMRLRTHHQGRRKGCTQTSTFFHTCGLFLFSPGFSYFFLFSSTKFRSTFSQWFHNQNSHHLEEFLLFSSPRFLTFSLFFLRSFFPLLLFCLESPCSPVSITSCWTYSPFPASPFLHCPFPSSNEVFLKSLLQTLQSFLKWTTLQLCVLSHSLLNTLLVIFEIC